MHFKGLAIFTTKQRKSLVAKNDEKNNYLQLYTQENYLSKMKIKQNHFQTKQEFTNKRLEYPQNMHNSLITQSLEKLYLYYIFIFYPPVVPSFLVLLLTHPTPIPTFIFKSLCQSRTLPSDTSIQQVCDQPCLLQTREECSETNSHKTAYTTIYNSYLSRANFPQLIHQFVLQGYQMCF